MIDSPRIENSAALDEFRTLARSRGFEPDDPWVGGYVAYEWTHARHFFQAYVPNLAGKRALEFGCNVGASGIVLAKLGAEVSGVDIDPDFVTLARAQAATYGLGSRLHILQLSNPKSLPFPDAEFDLIVCNSVLEYVDVGLRSTIQAELVRVLAPGGFLLVLGTSSRLWPREVHSQKWFVNYLPRSVDRVWGKRDRQRGVSPFSIAQGFRGCRNVDTDDASATYLRAKQLMGTGTWTLRLMHLAARLLAQFHLSVGMFTPSITMAFRKTRPDKYEK